jgi:hypothetical protein
MGSPNRPMYGYSVLLAPLFRWRSTDYLHVGFCLRGSSIISYCRIERFFYALFNRPCPLSDISYGSDLWRECSIQATALLAALSRDRARGVAAGSETINGSEQRSEDCTDRTQAKRASAGRVSARLTSPVKASHRGASMQYDGTLEILLPRPWHIWKRPGARAFATNTNHKGRPIVLTELKVLLAIRRSARRNREG